MLHEEVARYRELSGDTNPDTPISRIGGYLDGYEKALEQEPCDDAISRQAVIETIFEQGSAEKLEIDFAKLLLLQRAITALPSVNPQPKTGYWIVEAGDRETGYGGCTMCSECSGEGNTEMNYCPNCGAKMIELQESEDK